MHNAMLAGRFNIYTRQARSICLVRLDIQSPVSSSRLLLSQVSRIDPVSIITPQDCRDRDGRAKLGSKACSGSGSTGTRIPVLLKGDVFCIRLTRRPYLPSRTVDDVAQDSVLETNSGIFRPRTSEVYRPGRSSSALGNRHG